ncbi:MAG TPA: PhnD/SsuA/transferrin family substrate-binding protein [Candidatus Dormibacteraeota bacterium]|nr:PhnD/SsuA/transferrin family substrate-binding protein [Candidatus Dormibacteraeota bacterium]
MNATRAAVAARATRNSIGDGRPLVFATFLAPNVLPLYRFITGAVGERLGIETRLEVGTAFSQLINGEVDVAFLCGLPYVQLAKHVEPLAAPVLAGDRYRGQPYYFSDVIVARDSRFQSFADLRGASWSFNDPDSHSGYLVTLVRLLDLTETEQFFSRVVDSGWHQVSIELVASGRVDASAVDSHVLAVELRNRPELQNRLRVIDSLGPSPIQPVVARRALDAKLRRELRSTLLNLAGDRLGQGLVKGLVPVTDGWYDPIRKMLARVNRAALALSPTGAATSREPAPPDP